MSDFVDELLSSLPPAPDELTAEEHQRLENIRVNCEKSEKILRAVAELLMEKGYATLEEIDTRLNL